MDHLHRATFLEDDDLFDFEYYGIDPSIQDRLRNIFSSPTPEMADSDALFQVEEPLSPDSQGEVQQGSQDSYNNVDLDAATSQENFPSNGASFNEGYQNNNAASRRDDEIDVQDFYSSDYQYNSAANQREAQAEDQNSVGSHELENATSQEDVQGGNQNLEDGHQIDSAASLGDIESHDRSLDGYDQINSAASQKDVQSDEDGSQEDFQNDSSDETSADGDVKIPQDAGSLGVHDQADPEIDLQGEIDNMIADGIFKGLISDFDDYLSEPRTSKELREIKAAGIQIRHLSNVEIRYWVGQLFLAFKNVEGIQDKASKKGKPAQATLRLQGSYYPDRVIEQVCWQIVLDCSLSANGVRLIDAHHNAKCEKFDSFETRMTKIVDFCKVSKAACKQLLDPTYHDRLIDAPGYESFVKDTNRKINHKRDIQNLIGRSAMRKRGMKFDENLDLVKDYDYAGVYESEDEDDIPDDLAGKPLAKKSRPQPRPKESSPTTPLALKRKRRSIPAKNYKQSDEDATEDSDVSEYREVDDIANEVERSGPKRRAVESSSSMPATPSPLALPSARKFVVKKHQPSTPIASTQSQKEAQGGSLSATLPEADAFDSGSLDVQIYKGLGAMIDEVQSVWGKTAASSDLAEDSMGSSVTDRLPTALATLAPADQSPGSLRSVATNQTREARGSGAAHLRRGSMSFGFTDQHRHSVELANAYAGLGSMNFDFAVPAQGFMGASPVTEAQDFADSTSHIASLYGLLPASGPATQAPGPLAFSSAIQPHGFMAPVQSSQAPGTTGSDFHSLHFALPLASSMALKYDIPEPASDVNDLAKSQYKLAICEILDVHSRLASYYTLEELRMYGRAYNHQFWNDVWDITLPEGKKFTCRAFRLMCPSKGVVPHFALYHQKFAFLAVCRGDLTPDAEFNDKSANMNGFKTNGNELFNMALGVIPNPYGMIDSQTLSPRDNSELFGKI